MPRHITVGAGGGRGTRRGELFLGFKEVVTGVCALPSMAAFSSILKILDNNNNRTTIARRAFIWR